MGGVWSLSAAREEGLKCTGAAQPHTLQTGDPSPGLREAALSEGNEPAGNWESGCKHRHRHRVQPQGKRVTPNAGSQ